MNMQLADCWKHQGLCIQNWICSRLQIVSLNLYRKVLNWILKLFQDDGLADRRSQVTSAMCQAVRAGLTESELSEANDEMINQFLRATKLDIDKATKRLKATIAWRLKEQPHKRVCQMCNKTPGSHWLQVVSTFCLWHHDLLFWSCPFWLCL